MKCGTVLLFRILKRVHLDCRERERECGKTEIGEERENRLAKKEYIRGRIMGKDTVVP